MGGIRNMDFTEDFGTTWNSFWNIRSTTGLAIIHGLPYKQLTMRYLNISYLFMAFTLCEYVLIHPTQIHGNTHAPTFIDSNFFNITLLSSLALILTTSPNFLPLQDIVQTGTDLKSQDFIYGLKWVPYFD